MFFILQIHMSPLKFGVSPQSPIVTAAEVLSASTLRFITPALDLPVLQLQK